MCGIAGLLCPSGIDPAPLDEMLRLLRHRGPDGAGTATCGPAGAPWAALGIRRLAIVDPDGGHQPVSDPSGRFTLVMNGELYNHRRLRQELVADGVVLESQGDAEVLVALIARLGLRAALERCVGMFAFALVDRRDRRAWLVRDRMGQKPLYWTRRNDGAVAFASELRALGLRGGHHREIDPAAVRALLRLEYVPAPWTIFRGVQALRPGHLLAVDASGVTTHRWWTPPVPASGAEGDLGRWARSVHGALQVAVRQRLDADVPVGLLLSGGLDSGAVAAMAARFARAAGAPPLPSFSVSIRVPGFDEGPGARETAAALGTDHTELALALDDLGPVAEAVLAHMDEPLADSSLLPSWVLMAGVRAAGLRCVLSGDGADDSFGGYPTLLAHRIAAPLTPARGLVQRLAQALPTRHGGVTPDYMARRFATGLGRPFGARHTHWMGAWAAEELVPAPDEDTALDAIVDEHCRPTAGAAVASRALYLDQRMYLASGVLAKVDRASMAHGVEVRSPFLDHRLVALAAQIGDGHKLHGRRDKHVLREALVDELPAAVRTRPKKGFGGPVGPWLRGPGRALLDGLESVVPDHIAPARVAQVRAEHLAGTADHRRRLWSLIVLRAWLGSRWAL